jgi:hypothetical protein
MHPELKEYLLKLSLATDRVADFKISKWRLKAVLAARWLLRYAALSEEPSRAHQEILRALEKLCSKLDS